MLNIGEVAQQCCVTVETLRYYEREGLIPSPERGANGYRRYSPDVIRRIRFIKRAQDVGFTLKDTADLLSLRTDPGASCKDVQKRALEKLSEIDEKVEMLIRMRDILTIWANACPSEGPVSECPILDALDSE